MVHSLFTLCLQLFLCLRIGLTVQQNNNNDNNNSNNKSNKTDWQITVNLSASQMMNGTNTPSSSSKKQSSAPSLLFGTHHKREGWAWRLVKSSLFAFFSLILGLYNCLIYVVRIQYRNIKKHQAIRYQIVPLSPLTSQRLSVVPRKIMVLDLDETLIHSHHDGLLRQTVKPGTPPDFVLRVIIDNQPVRFFVHLRPHVEFFLSIVSQWFDLVVFTASMEIYGSSVADRLDKGRGILQRRYFRQHCTQDYNGYTKDLSAVHADLSSIFILDNSPAAYRNYTQNAIPIKSWFSDPSDTCLLNILPFLDALRFCADVRSILGRNQHHSAALLYGGPQQHPFNLISR